MGSCTRGTHRNMMKLLVLLLTVLLFVKEGFSIKCYECGGFPTNRATNPLCEGKDDFGREGGQTCQTDKGYSVCIKIEDPAGVSFISLTSLASFSTKVVFA